MSVGHEYMGGTRGSCIVSSAADEYGAWDERSMCLAQVGWEIKE